MKKMLKQTQSGLYHYADGNKIEGENPAMSGNCSELRGNCTGLYGNCSGLTGDCSGLTGDCTGLTGNLDDCQITDDERSAGVNITELIGEEK
jgi:hypothetical protein